MLPVLYQTLLVGLPFALLSALYAALLRRSGPRLWGLALLPGLLAAALLLYTEYSLHLQRQIDGVLAGLSLAALLLLATVQLGFWRRTGRLGEDETLLYAIVALLFAAPGLSRVLRPAITLLKKSAESSAGLNQSLLGESLSWLLALLLLAALGLALYAALQGYTRKWLLAWPFFLLLLAKDSIELLYGLLVMQLYEPGNLVYGLIVWHMNLPELAFFILNASLIALLLLLKLLAQRRRLLVAAQEQAANRAQKRMALARHRRRNRRIAVALGAVALFALSGLGGYFAAHRIEQLRPSTAVALGAQEEFVVAKAALEDGRIHRYTWVSPSGTPITFWLLKKREDNYGVVFDGCQICGPAGYIERGQDIVCTRCDVVMNRNTIGLRGGCNPIPIEGYRITDEQIVIPATALLEQEDFFNQTVLATGGPPAQESQESQQSQQGTAILAAEFSQAAAMASDL